MTYLVQVKMINKAQIDECEEISVWNNKPSTLYKYLEWGRRILDCKRIAIGPWRSGYTPVEMTE